MDSKLYLAPRLRKKNQTANFRPQIGPRTAIQGVWRRAKKSVEAFPRKKNRHPRFRNPTAASIQKSIQRACHRAKLAQRKKIERPENQVEVCPNRVKSLSRSPPRNEAFGPETDLPYYIYVQTAPGSIRPTKRSTPKTLRRKNRALFLIVRLNANSVTNVCNENESAK